MAGCDQPKELFTSLVAGDHCVRLPTAAQGFVDRDDAAIQVYFGLGLGVFGGQALALGVEQHQEVHGAFAVADGGEVGGGPGDARAEGPSIGCGRTDLLTAPDCLLDDWRIRSTRYWIEAARTVNGVEWEMRDTGWD